MMQYIVMDLEWNNVYSIKRGGFMNEVIEIGAVRLDEQLCEIDAFSHLAWVQHAFAGIRVCVCVLIFNAVLKLWKGAVKDVWGLVIFLVILALSVFTKLSPIIYVLAAAVAGLLIKNLGAKRS